MRELVFLALLLFQQPTAPQGMATISGRVAYADNSSAGVVVVAQSIQQFDSRNSNSTFQSTANSETGMYLMELPEGQYYVRTFDNIYHPGTQVQSEAVIVTVKSGSAISDVNISLPASMDGYRVRGRVIRPPEQPASTFTPPEVSSTVRGNLGSNIAWSASVSPDGSFEVSHVRPGRYSVFVNPAPGMLPIQLVVERDVFDVEVRVPKLVKVDGKFTTENGVSRAPSTRIVVILSGENTIPIAIMPDGKFNTFVPEGDYRMQMDRLPENLYLKSLLKDSEDITTGRFHLSISDKTSTIAATFARSSGVSVSGHVTGLAQTEKIGRIRFANTVDSLNVETVLSPDGTFSVPKMMPGSYKARITLNSESSSPPIAINVPDKNTFDLNIAVPAPRRIMGKVYVSGGGPVPFFTLYAIQNNGIEISPGTTLATLKTIAIDNEVSQIDVTARSDGQFMFSLPDGEYRVIALASKIPAPFTLEALASGDVDLLKEPFIVSEESSNELRVGFNIKDNDPWVRVSGHVTGVDPERGPFRISIQTSTTSPVETFVNSDGTFEFLQVVKGLKFYELSLIPENKAISIPQVDVRDTDVRGIEIVVPREREIAGHAVSENGRPVPSFVIRMIGEKNSFSVTVKPDTTGAFQIKVPEDPREFSIESLPLGYKWKSLSYGSTKLGPCAKSCPKTAISSYPQSELHVEFGVNPAVPFANVRGHISGLPPEGSVTIHLNDAASFSSFEEAVSADGTFEFKNIPQGVYVPVLSGIVNSSLVEPSVIPVTAPMPIVEIQYSAQKRKTSVSQSENFGVRETELGVPTGSNLKEAVALPYLRTLYTAQLTYLTTHGTYGTLSEMIAAGLLPEDLARIKNGYR
jgi:hypothetical protein